MITLESLTLGEILQKAGLNTLLGMGVVFTVLILISLLIYCMRFIPAMIDTMTGKHKAAAQAAGEPEHADGAAVAHASKENTQTGRAPAAVSVKKEEDLALIAVITAAIAAEANVPADGIVIRSIRRSARNSRRHA
ncbi:MAG: OadG family protein [Lachnospiraceae bacterium]|nr:OadG family protein [Lachnospiraceae bacterium]